MASIAALPSVTKSTLCVSVLGLAYYVGASPIAMRQAAEPFVPTWESTDKHTASPDWFKDAKFGVYWHWGAFTTPEWGMEWYPRFMYDPFDGGRHHFDTYGDPRAEGGFGWQNFTLGGNDRQGNFVQFKPILKSEGGDFDPEHWIEVIKASGAKFAGPVAEHHDGFSLWNSQVNEWNSVDLGPQLDLTKLFEELVRANDMKFMIAMHQAFNTNGYFGFAPEQSDPSLRRLLGQMGHEEGSERWLAKQLEVMDHVQPDFIWNDVALDSPGWCHGHPICAIREQERLGLLATYFNRGIEWGKEVLTCYKHYDNGFRDTSAVRDWERGGPESLTRPYWLTDEAISASSWSYTKGISYYSAKAMIHSLLDRVAKNGNMLLNVSPTASGALPTEQEQILRDIGSYLSRYAESIYETRAWDIYGEGPNQAGHGSFVAPFEGDSRDLRFTRSQDEKVLYATVLGWPENGVKIANLGSDRNVSVEGLQSVQLLGDAPGQFANARWEQNADGLAITMPTKPVDAIAYVLKLTFRDRIPVPQPTLGVTIWPEEQIADTTKGVTLEQGDFRDLFLAEAGVPDVLMMRVSGGTKVTVWTNGNLEGSWIDYFEGEHIFQSGAVGSLRIAKA